MAYNGTLCTEADIALYAGENVDATGDTEANHNLLIAQAESWLCGISRYNWVDNFAALNADVKAVLTEYCARFCAIGVISYNMAGYTSRIEAEDMINICLYRMKQLEILISAQNWVTYAQRA